MPPCRVSDVTHDLVGVELRGKEIVAIRLAPGRAGVPRQARRGDHAQAAQGRHQLAGALEFAGARMLLRIDAAVDEVHQRVVPGRRRGCKTSSCRSFRLRRVKATSTGLSMPPPQNTSTSLPSGRQVKTRAASALAGHLAVGVLELVSVAAVAPGDAAGGRDEAAVNVGRVADEAELVDDLPRGGRPRRRRRCLPAARCWAGWPRTARRDTRRRPAEKSSCRQTACCDRSGRRRRCLPTCESCWAVA